MKFSLNKNTISLAVTIVVLLLFFVAGAFDVLDYVIIKILLIGLTTTIAIIIASIFLKNTNLKKNRPENKLQDDYN